MVLRNCDVQDVSIDIQYCGELLQSRGIMIVMCAGGKSGCAKNTGIGFGKVWVMGRSLSEIGQDKNGRVGAGVERRVWLGGV